MKNKIVTSFKMQQACELKLDFNLSCPVQELQESKQR